MRINIYLLITKIFPAVAADNEIYHILSINLSQLYVSFREEL